MGTPEAVSDFTQQLSGPQFARFIGWANGMIRGRHPDNRDYSVASDVSVVVRHGEESIDFVPPLPADRPALISRVWEAAQRTPDPHASGVILGLGLNATHFGDGSGRMARYAYTLRTRGWEGTQRDRVYYTAVLGNWVGRQLVDLATYRAELPRLYNKVAADRIAERYGYTGRIPADVELPLENRTTMITAELFEDASKFAELLARENHFGRTNILAILLATGRNPEDYIMQRGPDPEDTFFDVRKLLRDIRPEELQVVVGQHRRIKTDFIDSIIACIADGDESVYGSAEDVLGAYDPRNMKLPSTVPPPPSSDFPPDSSTGLPQRVPRVYTTSPEPVRLPPASGEAVPGSIGEIGAVLRRGTEQIPIGAVNSLIAAIDERVDAIYATRNDANADEVDRKIANLLAARQAIEEAGMGMLEFPLRTAEYLANTGLDGEMPNLGGPSGS